MINYSLIRLERKVLSISRRFKEREKSGWERETDLQWNRHQTWPIIGIQPS